MLVTENLLGDILSDLAAGLVGGMGMAPSADIGDHHAVFQPAHGTAPDIAGKGIANPTALLLSSVMMLDWMQASELARKLERGVMKVYAEGKVRTGDLGGKATTKDFTQAVIDAMA